MNGTDFKLTRQLLDEALKEKITLSAKLEKLDPSSEHPHSSLDAFGRQLQALDIRVNGDYNAGIRPHDFGRFWENTDGNGNIDGRGEERSMLAAEWLARTYRNAAAQAISLPQNINGNWGKNGLEDGSRLFDSQAPLSYTLYPPTVLPELRFTEIQPTALPYLLARTRTISTETFMALYLNDTAATGQARFSRVEEWGEVPSVNFITSTNQIVVKKFGRRLRQSYEQMRRMSMDLVSWSINYIAARAARDKEDAALDILINGDTNSGTSATSNNGSTYDSGAAGKLTLKMWMGWRANAWTRPYRITTVIAAPNDTVSLYTLNSGSANIAPYVLMNQTTPQAVSATPVRTTFDGIQVVDNANVTAGTLVGIDRTATLEMVIEANSDIVETDRIIQRQYQEIVLTESLGFCIAILNQNQLLVTGS